MHMMTRSAWAAIALLTLNSAQAHVTVSSTPAFAGRSHIVVLNIPHGCENADTYKVIVDIPASFTSVRPADTAFGRSGIVRDDSGKIKQLVWTKAEGDLQDTDTHFYQVSFRATLPNTPFAVAYLPTVQNCRDSSGNESTAAWTAISDEHDHSNHGAAGGDNPAPSMMLYPARFPGWNRYTVNEHVHDLSVFKDAEIVWSGNLAFSANPQTMELIVQDPNVGVLDAIHPGTEIWVKY